MLMRTSLSALIILLSFPCSAQFWVEVNSGVVFPGYNDVRIPGDGGTLFSLEYDLQRRQDPVIPLRIRPGYTWGGRNHVFALYAPLQLDYSGTAPYPIAFQGAQFAAGMPVEGLYKFNSYRLGYRRDVIHGERWRLGIGLTGKIRDASIRLSSPEGPSARKDDLGFVPLVHLFLAYSGDGWSALLEGDGLAGGPGRAFDFLLGGTLDLHRNLALKGGYRILEGGSDTNSVYAFALFHFAEIGLRWQPRTKQP
jgi:hypothetical protein